MDLNTVETAAELGRELANATPPAPYELTPESSLVVRTVRTDHRIETVDLERLLDHPRRQHGTVTAYEPSSFARYVARLETPATTVWANEPGLAITAVFNDHDGSSEDGGKGYAGWRDHCATLVVQRDPDWAAWIQHDNTLTDQATFADQLEDQRHVIVEPDAATMLEVALSFHATRTAQFGQKVNIVSGDVQLSWSEETNAQAGSGRLDVPRTFTLSIAPFLGVQPIEVTARLIYRIKDGRLGIGYKLHRPDLAERAAFVDIIASVDEGIQSQVFQGTPPRLGRA